MSIQKGARVIAKTIRNKTEKPGKVLSVFKGRRGDFVRVKADDGSEFSTRPSLCLLV